MDILKNKTFGDIQWSIEGFYLQNNPARNVTYLKSFSQKFNPNNIPRIFQGEITQGGRT